MAKIKLEFGNQKHIEVSKKLHILNYRQPAEHQCDCYHCEADLITCPECDDDEVELEDKDDYYQCPECNENFATYWQRGNVIELFNKTFETNYNAARIEKVFLKQQADEPSK